MGWSEASAHVTVDLHFNETAVCVYISVESISGRCQEQRLRVRNELDGLDEMEHVRR